MSNDYIYHVGMTKELLDSYENFKAINFPGGGKIDYRSVLVATHHFLNEHVHPHVQARAGIKDRIYLTDHGPKHIEMVIRRASLLVRAKASWDRGYKNYECCLNPYEVFILVLAIHFHDVGNIHGREGHEQRIREEMEKVKALTLSWPEKSAISRIASCHGGSIDGNKDTIQTLEAGEVSDGEAFHRPQLLAAVLRFADELADESSRADSYGLLDPDKLPEDCLLFHKYAEGLRVSIDSVAGRINLKFHLLERDLAQPLVKRRKDGSIAHQYLIDEIYERTLKTYNEMLYCGRFMRDLDSAFHEVRVDIEIFEAQASPNPSANFHYTIGDVGYPDNGGTTRDILKRLARGFNDLPLGAQLADRINNHQPLILP